MSLNCSIFSTKELHQTEKERDALLLDFKNFISDELRVVSDALGEYTPVRSVCLIIYIKYSKMCRSMGKYQTAKKC